VIAPDVQAFLVQALERLISTHRDLAAAHQEFLAGPPTADRLAPLLDQREVTFALARDLENDLAVTLAEVLPGEATAGLSALAALLARELPEGPRLVEEWRQAVAAVVATDRDVAAVLDQARAQLSEEIKKIRRGASLLKGYLQPDETGSCFIDKIK
jgi:hypothetical protein